MTIKVYNEGATRLTVTCKMSVFRQISILFIFVKLFLEFCTSAPVRSVPAKLARVGHRRSVQGCPQDSYWDPIDDACVACQEICQPQHSEEFCRVNCPDYYIKPHVQASIDSSSSSNARIFRSTTLVSTVAIEAFVNSVDEITDMSRYHTVLVGVLVIFCFLLSTVLVIVLVCVCRRTDRVPCFGSKISSHQKDTNAHCDAAKTTLLSNHQTLQVQSRGTVESSSDNSSDSCLDSVGSSQPRSISDDQISILKVAHMNPQWSEIQIGFTLQVADRNCTLSPVPFSQTQPLITAQPVSPIVTDKCLDQPMILAPTLPNHI